MFWPNVIQGLVSWARSSETYCIPMIEAGQFASPSHVGSVELSHDALAQTLQDGMLALKSHGLWCALAGPSMEHQVGQKLLGPCLLTRFDGTLRSDVQYIPTLRGVGWLGWVDWHSCSFIDSIGSMIRICPCCDAGGWVPMVSICFHDSRFGSLCAQPQRPVSRNTWVEAIPLVVSSKAQLFANATVPRWMASTLDLQEYKYTYLIHLQCVLLDLLVYVYIIITQFMLI